MGIPLKHALTRTAVHATASLHGLTPIGRHQSDDIFVVGFPKSGNTWFQYLLAGALCGVDASRCPDSLVQELVPDVHSRLSYLRHTSPVFFKSHDLPRPDYRRVIYLLRDGRDAMVSYFHYYNTLFPTVDFHTLVRTAPGLPSKWHIHADAWSANPHQAQILLVKYEDLKKDATEQLHRVRTFAQLKISDLQIEQAVQGASFANMKQREQKLGWSDPHWPADKPFVRRGSVGSFRDEMPANALTLFETEAGPTLRRYGYSP